MVFTVVSGLENTMDIDIVQFASDAKLLFENSSYYPPQNVDLAKSTTALSATSMKSVQTGFNASARHGKTVSPEDDEMIFEDEKLARKLKTTGIAWQCNLDIKSIETKNYDGNKFRNIIVGLNVEQNVDSIYQHMERFVNIFMVNLHSGSIRQFKNLIAKIEECKTNRSSYLDIAVDCSTIAVMHPRRTITGRLRKNLKEIKLHLNERFIVTCDREYAVKGSKNVVYVNCELIIGSIKPNEYIHIEDITLRVIKQVKKSIECVIVQEGFLRVGQRVIFSCHQSLNEISAEELDDIKFAKSNYLQLATPTPGCNTYFDSIRSTIQSIEYNSVKVLATVSQCILCTEEYVKWIADTYDGIILKVEDEPRAHQILQLNPIVKYLIECCYKLKKLILISSFLIKDNFQEQIVIVCPESEKHFFYYPDGYILQEDERGSVQLTGVLDDVQARIEHFAWDDLCNPFIDTSSTGSDGVARAVVRNAYDINAAAILVCTVSGRMAVKLSHFRPNCPIIAISKSKTVAKMLAIYQNICVAFYKEDTSKATDKLSKSKLNLKKLKYGLLYGMTQKLIPPNRFVIFGFRTINNFGYPNKFSAFRPSSYFGNELLNDLNKFVKII